MILYKLYQLSSEHNNGTGEMTDRSTCCLAHVISLVPATLLRHGQKPTVQAEVILWCHIQWISVHPVLLVRSVASPVNERFCRISKSALGRSL